MDRRPDPIVARLESELLPRFKEAYKPELVLLFGSRARGDALQDSDVDLLVVSERFRGVPFLERAVQALQDLDASFAVDMLCYTPEEFEGKRQELGVVSAALEEGLAL
jgi:predicted nucleotidyltransferase